MTAIIEIPTACRALRIKAIPGPAKKPAVLQRKNPIMQSRSFPSLFSLNVANKDLADLDVKDTEVETEENLRRKYWKGAIKLPMYSVALIPVLVSSAVAFFDTGAFHPQRVFRLVLGSICVIAWLNLANDYFDHETGCDDTKLESIVALTQNKPLIERLSYLFLTAGLVLLCQSVYQSKAFDSAWMLLLSILCGYVYQGPPFRLSYKGLGEPLCFVAFGPLATTAFYLMMIAGSLQMVSPTCWASSILVGLTTTMILFCSHFHQVKSDLAAKKYSPVVRLGGPDKAFQVLRISMVCFFLLTFGFVFVGWLPRLMIILSIGPAFLATQCILFAKRNLSNLPKLKFLKLKAINVHAASGLALILACILNKQLTL